MNETLKILFNRRSTRVFKSEQIKDEDLQTILEAGRFAPSAMNQQAWHFTAVQNKEVLQKINTVTKTVFENSGIENFQNRAKAENFSPFYNAPTYIIISVNEKAIAPQFDSAVALENMFLAAEALGIDSCWIHAINYLNNVEAGKNLFKELGIPEGFVPLCSGAFGYSAVQKPEPSPRREGTVNIIK